MYKEFTSTLNQIFEDNFDFNQSFDFDTTTLNVISEIKEKLFELQTNEQRIGFLKSVFRGFFDNGKDYIFYSINNLEDNFNNLPREEKKYTEEEFAFLYNCLLCLRSIVTDISEEALIYGIDFNDVMLWSWRYAEDKQRGPEPYEVFVYYVKRESSDQQTEVTKDTLPKSSIFKGVFSSYGFFELEKVSELTDQQKDSLVMKLSTGSIPYVIAMFNYLGFLEHLKNQFFTTNYKLFKGLSEWLGTGERTVKGNILVLHDKSKENRSRYTSHEYKSQVENDYKNIK